MPPTTSKSIPRGRADYKASQSPRQVEAGKALPQPTPDTLTHLHTQDMVLQFWKAPGPFPYVFFREPLGNCTSVLVTFCETWFTCFLTGAQCRPQFLPCKLTTGYLTIFKARLTGFALEDPEPPLPRLVLPTRVGPVPPSWCLLVDPWLFFEHSCISSRLSLDSGARGGEAHRLCPRPVQMPPEA